MKKLTREDIVGHKNIADFLQITDVVGGVIDGDIGRLRQHHFLVAMADLMCVEFPEIFRFLELGVFDGDSLCALSYKHTRAEYEKYAGTGSNDSADKNIRYFGGNARFALFDGDDFDVDVQKRINFFLRGEAHMIYAHRPSAVCFPERVMKEYADLLAPGGLMVFAFYNDNDGMASITKDIDAMDKTGWNVIGALAPDIRALPLKESDLALISAGRGSEVKPPTQEEIDAAPHTPTLFVIQKEVE